MLASLMIDQSRRDSALGASGLWLAGSAALTFGYIVAALILIGLPGLSRTGALMAAASALWLIVGLASRQATFPPILFLPLAFYGFMLISGLGLDAYPVDYAGQLTTIWLGGITLAAFIANGVSMNLIVSGFVLVCLANVFAMAIGYDGYQININDYSAESLKGVEIRRLSGLAGQPNLLVALMFVLPFALFLLRRKIGLLTYLVLLAGCIAVMVLTASRSAIPFTAMFAVFGAVFLLSNTFSRSIAIGAGLIGVVLTGIFMTSPDAVSRIERSQLGKLVIVERTLSGLDGTDNSAEVREELATEFWPQFVERPLLGWGPNQFSEVSGDGNYAHNNFAEIAINWGVVGLLLYYSMYIAACMAVLGGAGQLPAIATLLFLVAADNWFVTLTERPLVLLLCLMLVTTSSLYGASGRHRSKSGRRRRRSTRSASRAE